MSEKTAGGFAGGPPLTKSSSSTSLSSSSSSDTMPVVNAAGGLVLNAGASVIDCDETGIGFTVDSGGLGGAATVVKDCDTIGVDMTVIPCGMDPVERGAPTKRPDDIGILLEATVTCPTEPTAGS
mmetsp:Transcript_31461/g.73490  ORF Transcript_31461/g.73490 Transcript_31461/m.73490 type:complete len:125 (+) Transcript_31461:533-907(+)